MKKNLPITDQEYNFPANINILSLTDLKGIIRYVNHDFCQTSGFDENELVGKNHNVVRHPDMPQEAFQDLWDTLKAGRSWMGLVKNRRKNGDFYWVDSIVTPISRDGKVAEYQSVRTLPGRLIIKRAEKLYAGLLAGKRFRFGWLASLAMRYKLFAVMGLSVLPLVATSWLQLGSVATIIATLASFLVALTGATFVLRPFKAVVAEARSLVDNPLMQYVYTGRGDDVAQVALAIRKMKSEARAIIGRMEESAAQIKEVAKEMDATVALAGQEASHQEREISQVQTAIQQLSATIVEIASNAADASDAAQIAERGADDGKRVVQASIQSIEEVAAEVDRIHDVMERLVQQSGDINSIVTVIQDISEQTNLLALNAAIEAARAGEQGRGFAVVADEVRTLASRTQESTKEIQAKIDRLQQDTQEAAREIQKSKQATTAGVEQAVQAGTALDQITEAVSAITGMNALIASATEEQRVTAEGVNEHMEVIAGVAEMSADGV
ncbi:MAG: methyl-accepting chemotaxis protein, partial [Gammaproteobacteria bacterium]|nr:methyl-accepting chemotaxis protein [Gammaproteobacteria bacterium]